MASQTPIIEPSKSDIAPVARRTPWGWSDVLAIAIWSAVVAWFFRDVVSLRRALFFFDITEINLPYRIFFADELRAGRFSRWCPGLYCGLPLFSESQAGYFHPLKFFLYPWMAAWKAFNLDTILSIWLTGLGTYGWLRRHVGAAGALTGAAVFGAGGFVWAHFVHTSMINALASVPLIVWGLEWSWETGRWRGAVLSGVAIACQVFAGHLQDVFLSSGIVGIYGLYRAATESTARARIRAFSVAMTAILIGCLLGGVQWIPSKELLDRSPRAGGLTWDKLTFASWHPELVPTLVIREAYGTRAQDTDWMDGFYPYHEMDSYLGLIALGLAVLGAGGSNARDRWINFWVILAGLGGILMLGRFTFLFDLAHRIPMAGSSREPVRFHLWVSLAIAALAASGVDRLSRPGKIPLKRAFLLPFCLIAASLPILVYIYSPIWNEPDRWRDAIHLALFRRLRYELIRSIVRTAILAGLACGFIRWAARAKDPAWRARIVWALPLLIMADLFGSHAEDIPTVSPTYWTEPPASAIRLKEDPTFIRLFGVADSSAAEPGYAPEPLAFMNPKTRDQSGTLRDRRSKKAAEPIDFMKVRDPLDWSLPLAWGIKTARGETPMISKRMLDYTDNAPSGRGRFDIESVSHILAGRRSSVASSFPGDIVGSALIHRNRGVLPRVRLMGHPIYVADQSEAGRVLADPKIDPRTRPIVEDSARPLPEDAEVSGTARIVEEIPERVMVETESAGPSYLVMSDTYDPGWSATLDGQSVSIRPVYATFRAVYLPAGRHEIVFSYRPAGFSAGLGLTALGILSSLILWFRQPIATFRPEHSDLTWPSAWRPAFFLILGGIVLVSTVGFDRSGAPAVQSRWSRSLHGFTWGAGIEAMRQMQARE